MKTNGSNFLYWIKAAADALTRAAAAAAVFGGIAPMPSFPVRATRKAEIRCAAGIYSFPSRTLDGSIRCG
jgi:hypothetical protein